MILFSQLLFSVACIHTIKCNFSDAAREYNEIYKIPRQNKAKRLQKFSQYSIEKQIDVYLFARSCADDPQIGPLLYENGEKRIPNIVERVEVTETIFDKAQLVALLLGINKDCQCITKDLDVIKRLENVEKDFEVKKDALSDYHHKGMYSTYFNALKEQIDERSK